MLPSCVSDVHRTTLAELLTQCQDGVLARRLEQFGLEPTRAASFAAAANRLVGAGVAPSTRVAAFWVPGRVEVMGKHTDYCAGRSLLCAVNRGFAVVSADRDDSQLRILATFELSGAIDEATLPLAAAATGEQALPDGWAMYPAVTARRLARNFGLSLGVDLALSCDLPEASGMSSSSAVIILTFLALAARNELAARPEFRERLPTAEDLCHYLGCIENGQSCGPGLPGDAGVGTFGGSEDHTAILLCQPGELAQYSFCPTRLEAVVPFPRSMTMLLAVSGATAQKGAERLRDYNDAAMLARWAASAAAAESARASGRDAASAAAAASVTSEAGAEAACSPPKKAAKMAQGAVAAAGAVAAKGDGRTPPTAKDASSPPTLAAVVAAEADRLGATPLDARVVRELSRRIGSLDDGAFAPGIALPAGALVRRFRQFYEESELLVPWVCEAMRRGDAGALGALVDRSHELTESHLRNTVEETEWLPRSARRLGASAASAFGAGFGGSVWAMVDADKANELLEAWEADYTQRFPERKGHARFFAMRTPAPGARCVS